MSQFAGENRLSPELPPPGSAAAAGVILASASAARKTLLESAGVSFSVRPAHLDEAALRHRLQGMSPAEVALSLASEKALAVSREMPQALVIGADQVLAFEGKIWGKAADMKEARALLLALRGRTHALHSAVAVAKNGHLSWKNAEEARLTMREFSEIFLEGYLESEGLAVCQSAGGYRIEGRGIQLFERIEGGYFTVLGLPLLPLLAYLREEGVVNT